MRLAAVTARGRRRAVPGREPAFPGATWAVIGRGFRQWRRTIDPMDDRCAPLVVELDVSHLQMSVDFYRMLGFAVAVDRPDRRFAYLTLDGCVDVMLQAFDGPGERVRIATLERPLGAACACCCRTPTWMPCTPRSSRPAAGHTQRSTNATTTFRCSNRRPAGREEAPASSSTASSSSPTPTATCCASTATPSMNGVRGAAPKASAGTPAIEDAQRCDYRTRSSRTASSRGVRCRSSVAVAAPDRAIGRVMHESGPCRATRRNCRSVASAHGQVELAVASAEPSARSVYPEAGNLGSRALDPL